MTANVSWLLREKPDDDPASDLTTILVFAGVGVGQRLYTGTLRLTKAQRDDLAVRLRPTPNPDPRRKR